MTPDEQRIAIAEACGWSDIKQGPYDGQPFGRQLSHQLLPLPDYLEDLNAIHEAVATLSRDRYDADDGFTYQLARIVHGLDEHGIEAGWNFRELQEATAAQRAEAFLRTISKWKDQ